MLWCIKEHDWQGEWQQAAPEGRPTYTLSVVLEEHAFVFFISASFAQDCFFR